MWHALEWFLDTTDRKRRRAQIEKALALNLRGEARSDGLEMTSLCSRLEIEWRARDIHPWDLGVALERRAAMFVEQCLSDADAAIMRLFDKLPWVDIIDVNVLDPDSDETIMTGTVYRPAPEKELERSAAMRVKDLGLNYRVRGWKFESLKPETGDRWLDSAAVSNSASRLSSGDTRSPLRPATRRG